MCWVPTARGRPPCVRILSTLLGADGGTATIAGHDVMKEPRAVRRVIGLTGQDTAVDELLTGEENLVMMGQLFRLGGAASGGEPPSCSTSSTSPTPPAAP
ncbi:hypothetical protein SBADM41S_03735 [Streptomyces badius]